MNGLFLSDQALEQCLKLPGIDHVLDIGSGQGLHAKIFKDHGKRVTTLDASEHWGKPDILGSFSDHLTQSRIMARGPYQLIWCSHVLEHQRNVGKFLDDIFRIMDHGSWLAVTVPPAKHEIVGGHLTLWNAGLLLYNLILAGFDCKKAMCKSYGYNISVIVQKKPIPNLDQLNLFMDCGDIEKLAPYFPMPVQQGFNGHGSRANWPD